MRTLGLISLRNAIRTNAAKMTYAPYSTTGSARSARRRGSCARAAGSDLQASERQRRERDKRGDEKDEPPVVAGVVQDEFRRTEHHP